MQKPQIQKVVIAGGGTAGWLTAGLIAANHQHRIGKDLSITLIESPDIAAIGVGEGTWPSMRDTLKKIGLRETDLFQKCDASFKQGAKFAKWITGEKNDFYYHPLVLPTGFYEADLAAAWLSGDKKQSFADAVCSQSHLCEQGLAPKQITTPEYAAVANYAYHLDSVKLGSLLKQHCTEKLNVAHVSAHISAVNPLPNGDIGSLTTSDGHTIEGELFIDCTGLNSLLLGKHFQVPFHSKTDVLFNDRALAIQIPYENEDDPIACHTISTAQKVGWTWDIGLPTRKGVGLVYASEYMTDDAAEKVLQDYIAESLGEKKAGQFNPRLININPGHREHFWHKNCVAVGLSAGFLEPLEASALVLVESAAAIISDELPSNRKMMDIVAKRFNKRMHYYWDTIVDFLKLHYLLSKRTDHQYWLDHRDPAHFSDGLKDSLDLWRFQVPNQYDFPLTQEMFPAASWQYVLYGMGFETELLGNKPSKSINTALKFMHQSASFTEKCIKGLQGHREVINRINQFGMQKI